MKNSASIIAATLLLAATLGVTIAGQMNLDLKGTAETPPVTTQASGLATLSVDSTGMVTGGIKTSGIDGTAAHIHMGKTGTSGPPVITLTSAGKDQWKVPEGSKLSTEQYEAYKKGNLYINVHSKDHPSGEIRAQLTPQSGP
jgi:hypothetical protein